jgi:heavy metal sensor kinase
VSFVSSLKGRITLLSAGVFLVLYVVAFGLVLAIDARNGRRDLEIMLYAEAEALAGYWASTGRFDFPELNELEEHTPIPIMMRLVDNGEALAQTPGLPNLVILQPEEFQFGALGELRASDGAAFGVVRHEVWEQPGVFTEALTSMDLLGERRRTLALGLAVAGLFLVPLAGLGGRLLATRSLRPVDQLVASTRAIDSRNLSARLKAPGAVDEVAQLANEFNRLLGRLEESVDAMKQFTADASHELRTPISILRTGLEVALRKERTAEDYREVLEENLVEIERVQRIVEGLLTLAKADADAQPQPSTELVDLTAVVAAAAESVRPAATEKLVELTCDVEPEVAVRGNVDQLRLLVMNLLDNAVKFTGSGKRVEMSLRRDDNSARLRVRDEGVGVSAADGPHIFDRFFRGGQARASGSGAGGLGLSVVKWVAESHGGGVRLVDDDEPGATFEVELPAARPGEPALAVPA